MTSTPGQPPASGRASSQPTPEDHAARYQQLLEMSLDAIVTIDQHGIITEFNHAAEQTFRCTMAEVLGKSFGETFVARDSREPFIAECAALVRSGAGPLSEQRTGFTCIRGGGSLFPAEITARALPFGDDTIITLFIHDLTDHKWNTQRRITRYRVTRILAETDSPTEALPDVLEAICEGLEWDWAAVWMREPGSTEMRIELSWHRESIETGALEIASRQKPFTPGVGFLGDVWMKREPSWIPDIEQPNSYRRIDAARACGIRSIAAMPIFGRTEVMGVAEFHSQRVREPDSEMLRLLDSLGSQIGQYIERRQVEEERIQLLAREQAARTAAEAAERRLAFLAEASAQLSESLDWEVTLKNVARLAVPKLADYCAIDMLTEAEDIRRLEIVASDETKDSIVRELNKRHPIRTDSTHPIATVMQTGRPVLYPEIDDEILHIFTGGIRDYVDTLRKMQIESAMFVPLTARGRNLGVISFVASDSGLQYGTSDLALAQELARRAALAIDNARLYREAQDAIRVREEFLSIASHELKTPLTTVKGYSQILARSLRRELLDRDRLGQLIQQLQSQLGRFETLIADLLDISRIQQGRLELRPEETDLVELARNIINRFAYQTEPAPIHTLRIDGPTSYTGRWDPSRLDQVLTNLISNAIKYSPDGGEIVTRITPIGTDRVELSVTDPGIGIPKAEQGQLFRPFARSETVQRAISGVGLGLYITAQIVERHGGQIELESDKGEGSTFTISLPRYTGNTHSDTGLITSTPTKS